MAITLSVISGSPPSWKVWLALEFKQLPYELRMLSISDGDLKTPAFAALNPRKQVPVLTDGAITIYESEAIVRYLEDAHPTPTLFPGDIATRALIYRMGAEATAYFAQAQEELVEEILRTPDPAQRSAERIAAAAGALRAELAHFERELRGDFLAGPLSAADFALYPGLMLALRMDRRQPGLGVADTLGPRLSAWKKRIEGLPYLDRTYPPHWRNT